MSAKMSFELDAGKILAKLHRGACQLYEGKGFIFINTGIIDDQNKLQPEQVDKSKINFDLEGGEYEIGLMFPTKQAIDQLKADVSAAEEEEEEEEDTQHANSDKASIMDNPDEEKRQLNEDYTKNSSAAGDNPESKNTPKTNEQNKHAEKLKADMLAMHTATDPKEINALGKSIADETKALADTAKEAAAEAVAKNHDQIKKFMEQHISHAAKYLTEYIKTFAGKDAAANINEDKMALCYVPEGFDPYKTKKYDNYQIPVMSDEQVREYKIKLLKKNPGEFNIERMCFKIAYSLDIGK